MEVAELGIREVAKVEVAVCGGKGSRRQKSWRESKKAKILS